MALAAPDPVRAQTGDDTLGSFFGRLFERNAPAPTPAPPSEPVYPVVTIAGAIDERPAPYDFVVSETPTINDIVQTLRKAKADPFVEGLVLYIDEPDLGWAQMEQIRRAVLDFQSTGRVAHAYLFSMDSQAYLLATACKKITMAESSLLFMTGLRADLYFVRDLLDKIGVKADVIAIGRYKDAMETFTENEMTGPTREMMTSLVDDLTSLSVGMIAESRALSRERARELFEGGPYTADEAARLGLIDKVEYYDQAVDDLEADAGHAIDLQLDYGAKDTGDEEIGFFALFQEIMQGAPEKTASTEPYIALVYAVGEIVPGTAEDYPFSTDLIALDDFLEVLDDIEYDDQARAVVLRIDSPGGSAEVSDIIWNRLKILNESLPIVVSMGDLAASGGYYIATPADTIFAERGTLTGSIGVIGAKPVLGELYNKIGIHVQSIGGGKYSGLFAEDRLWNDEERAKMRSLMEDTYSRFTRKVAEDRGMTVDAVKAVAEGRVWTGRQGLEVGLVDRIGGLDAAIDEAKVLAGFNISDDVETVVYPRPEGFVDYLSRVVGMSGVSAGRPGVTASASSLAAGKEAARRPGRAASHPVAPGVFHGGLATSQAVLAAESAGLLPIPFRHALVFSTLIRNSRFLARAPYELRIR